MYVILRLRHSFIQGCSFYFSHKKCEKLVFIEMCVLDSGCVCVLGSQTWSAEICEFCVSGDGLPYE